MTNPTPTTPAAKLWLLIEQGDTPQVNSVVLSREHGEMIAQQHNSEFIEVDEVENAEDVFDIRGNEVSFILQAIAPTPTDEVPKPTAYWDDGDTAALILFDDGSVYTWDEKGAVCVDKDGKILNTYWRGDAEPFDVRQVAWHHTWSAEELDAMTGPARKMTEYMSEASYNAIHYTQTSPEAVAGAAELISVVKAEVK